MSNSERSFNDFWERIIERAIRLCFKQLDPDFSERAKVVSRQLSDYKDDLELMYRRKRNWLKQEYLPEEKDPSLDMHKLSSVLCRCVIGHKFFGYDVSAVEQIQAERKFNPNISHSEQIAWENSNIYVNYKLAFLVAEGTAYDDLIYWAQGRINQDNKDLRKIERRLGNDDSDESLLQAAEEIKQHLAYTTAFKERLCAEGKLRRYVCTQTHDDYVSSMIVALMKSDCLMRDFDYLSMAANMFQWQEYTKVCIFTELITEQILAGSSGSLSDLLSLCIE